MVILGDNLSDPDFVAALSLLVSFVHWPHLRVHLGDPAGGSCWTKLARL